MTGLEHIIILVCSYDSIYSYFGKDFYKDVYENGLEVLGMWMTVASANTLAFLNLASVLYLLHKSNLEDFSLFSEAV